MDDLWGEDLPDDVVEECAILASQVSEVPNNSVRNNVSVRNDSRNYNLLSTSASFKSDKDRSFQLNRTSSTCLPPPKSVNNTVNIQHSNISVEEIKKLKEENKRLLEENMVRCGETSILRSDLQQLRHTLENQIQESSTQIDTLKKQIKDANGQITKQQETHQTEMKFKELELEELRTKLKQIEKIGNQPRFTNNSQQINLPTANKGFLNRNLFDCNAITPLDRKANVGMVDSAVQTVYTKRFDLDKRGIYPTTDAQNIIGMLRSLLALQPGQAACHMETIVHDIQMALEHLEDQDWNQFLNQGGSEVINTFYQNLEHYRVRDDWEVYSKLVHHCMLQVLPQLESKSEEYLQTILKESEKLSVLDMLQITTSVIQNFGFKPLCQKISGCFLEAALRKSQDTYKDLVYDDALELILALANTLSTLFSSVNGIPEKNCTCISQLLRLLALAVQHQYRDCDSSKNLIPFRMKIMTRILRVSLGILNARSEPWLTLIQSHSDNNRLWAIVTTVSDIVSPKEVLTEVELGLLSGYGFS